MNEIVHQQLIRLKEAFPDATVDDRPDGTALITVPNIPIPEGWNKRFTTVHFIAPIGYPQAKPDCFWADADLKLTGGNPPKNSGLQTPPFRPELALWLSWHVSDWNANKGNLLTFVQVIRDRLNRPE